MSDDRFVDALRQRAADLGVDIPGAAVPSLERYVRLLIRWNRTVNLTALPIEQLAPEAIDRLLLEPLSAAPHFPAGPVTWIDLGSGGGSPAIPLKLVHPGAALTMVESRSRKVAFLREVIRELKLRSTDARRARFEELVASTPQGEAADVVTVRAVRIDADLVGVVRRLLRPGGQFWIFDSAAENHPALAGSFAAALTVILLKGQSARLSLFRCADSA